jgi:uncharacterized protein (TIGR03437 family)
VSTSPEGQTDDRSLRQFGFTAAGLSPELFLTQQINILIPAGTPSGPATPLVLSIGGVSTQAGVTLAIQD